MKNWPWFLLSLVVIGCDQGAKYLALYHLSPYDPKPILPLLNFTLAYNTGAAFSFLSQAGDWHQWFFLGFSLIMSGVLIVWIWRTNHAARTQLCALSLILGGAIGNLIDRAHLGSVVDFVDVYIGAYHWPVFNVADSAICVGAALLFFELIGSKQSKKEEGMHG